jgi:hypothetical protein
MERIESASENEWGISYVEPANFRAFLVSLEPPTALSLRQFSHIQGMAHAFAGCYQSKRYE